MKCCRPPHGRTPARSAIGRAAWVNAWNVTRKVLAAATRHDPAAEVIVGLDGGCGRQRRFAPELRSAARQGAAISSSAFSSSRRSMKSCRAASSRVSRCGGTASPSSLDDEVIEVRRHGLFCALIRGGPRWTGEIRPLIDRSKPATTGMAAETGEFYFVASSGRKSVWTFVRQLRGPHFRTCA